MNMLTEEYVRDAIKRYFTISEFVDARTEKAHGARSWKFLDYRLLYAILIIRENLGRPMTINSGSRQQRGLRTILQQIVKNYFYKDKLYLSAHLLGKAVDFDVQGMTAHEVRQWIFNNSHLFPFKIRLEDLVTWVHLDVIFEEKNPLVYFFAPPK